MGLLNTDLRTLKPTPVATDATIIGTILLLALEAIAMKARSGLCMISDSVIAPSLLTYWIGPEYEAIGARMSA